MIDLLTKFNDEMQKYPESERISIKAKASQGSMKVTCGVTITEEFLNANSLDPENFSFIELFHSDMIVRELYDLAINGDCDSSDTLYRAMDGTKKLGLNPSECVLLVDGPTTNKTGSSTKKVDGTDMAEEYYYSISYKVKLEQAIDSQ